MSTAAALLLTFAATSGCELDSAVVTFVPPATARVLLTEICGPATCWTRFLVLDADGRRRAESRVCDLDVAGRPLVSDPLTPGKPR